MGERRLVMTRQIETDLGVKFGEKRPICASEFDRHDRLRVLLDVIALDDNGNSKIVTNMAGISDSDAILFTYHPVSIGTCVMLRIGGKVAALGEVESVHICESCGMARMIVEISEKNSNWPLQ
jgi:hypothetical protein